MDALRRPLDVLRIVIQSAQDDQILQPGRNIKFALMQKSHIPGSQISPAVRLGLRARTESCFVLFVAAPISTSDSGGRNPDLADLVWLSPAACLGIDDQN